MSKKDKKEEVQEKVEEKVEEKTGATDDDGEDALE